MRRSTRHLIVVGLTTIGAAWLAGCDERGVNGAGGGRPPAAAAEVRLAPVELRAVERSIDVTGTLHGEEEATIAAKVPGRVESIGADLGDDVLPGGVLAQIERRDYELALEERRTAVRAELAKIGLSELPGEPFDPSEVPSVARARAEAANAESRFRRAESLYTDNPPVISAEEHADARTAWEVAINGAQVELLTARAVLAEARALASQEAAAEQRLADTTIRAPGRAGDTTPRFRVAERQASIGEFVSQGRAVFRLVAADVVKFRADVPERFIGQVAAGQVAQVRVEAYEDGAAGRVSRISPSIDPQNRMFRVEIVVANTDGRLKPGAFARGSIVTGVDDGARTVPEGAVVTFAGIHKVFSVKDGLAVEHRVRLGARRDGWVEIAGGLDAEAVVSPGLPGLSNGASVRVVDP